MQRKHKVGDDVVYVNDYGVCWGIRKVIGIDERNGKPTYYIEPTDCPWFSVDENNLTKPEPSDYFYPRARSLQYFQDKYGFDLPPGSAEALLDTDPFEGES